VKHARENHKQDRQEDRGRHHPGPELEAAGAARDPTAPRGTIPTVGLESISTGRATGFGRFHIHVQRQTVSGDVRASSAFTRRLDGKLIVTWEGGRSRGEFG